MLFEQDLLKPVFFKSTPLEPKDIHFIRVDGASDEAPSHVEVQFLWTEIHISTPTKVTLVTTRYSGDSFLNRVELQNGCLARGHSNLFVPSTLVGSFSSFITRMVLSVQKSTKQICHKQLSSISPGLIRHHV